MYNEIEYNEVVIVVDGEEYAVSFVATEVWDYRDEGYADFSDYQWALDSLTVSDIVWHEYLNEHDMCLNHEENALTKSFADSIRNECLNYAIEHSETPKRDAQYYYDLDNITEDDLYPSFDPGYYPYD